MSQAEIKNSPTRKHGSVIQRAWSRIPATEKAPLAVLIVLVVFMSAFAPKVFFSFYNLLNVLSTASVIAIMACGMTFVIICGGIDLSIGSVFAFGSAVAVGLGGRTSTIAFLPNLINLPPWLGIVIGIVVSLCLGLFNGIVTTRLKVTPFIATLGMMGIARGLTYLYTDGFPLDTIDSRFRLISNGAVGFITFPIILAAIAVVLSFVILNRTTYGRYIYAVGQNETIARLNTIPTQKIKLMVYGMMGALAGLSGIIMASKVNSAYPAAGEGYEIDVITVVVLGGTSLFGGEGTIRGTVMGVLIMGILSNALGFMGVSIYFRHIVTGALLIVAIISNFYFKKQNRR